MVQAQVRILDRTLAMSNRCRDPTASISHIKNKKKLGKKQFMVLL